MAHGSLQEFDDFHERFDFCCVANNICNDAAHQKKALFLTLLGQVTYSKLMDLASPTPVSELTLEDVMRHLEGHYRPKTIEIAEHFKFFKRRQQKSESAAEFMA